MGTSVPDASAMESYCRELLPKVLREACDVDQAMAEEVGRDVYLRARSFAAMNTDDQFVLTAPFVEESYFYEPAQCRYELRAAVTVVVRNSRLEQVHAGGPVNSGGLEALTTAAAAPLSHLLGAAQDAPPQPEHDQLGWIKEAYPRAWACLTALGRALETGARVAYRLPAAPMPELPDEGERVEAKKSADGRSVVLGALDLRFDDELYAQMEAAIEGPLVVYVPSLSRFSRDSGKLHRVLEFFLAHDATILTTNYLLRSGDVYIRTGMAVEPDSRDYWRGVRDLQGLQGVHRKIVRALARQLAD